MNPRAIILYAYLITYLLLMCIEAMHAIYLDISTQLVHLATKNKMLACKSVVKRVAPGCSCAVRGSITDAHALVLLSEIDLCKMRVVLSKLTTIASSGSQSTAACGSMVSTRGGLI